MTAVRGLLLLLAVVAAADGAFLEALFIVAFVVVLFVFAPGGWGRRPVPFRVWWRGGGWRE